MLSTISVKKIRKLYHHIPVIQDITIELQQGKSYAIMGSSGSGKSTLLSMLSGLEKPSSGSVFFNNQNITTCSSQELPHFLTFNIGIVLQSPHLIQELTILENVILPALIAGKSRQESTVKAEQLLKKVGIETKINHIPPQLSGGQQQRAALARALMNDPAFLLADEPTGNLDKHTGNKIIELFVSYQKQENKGIIISTHDINLANQMDFVYELKDGILYEKPFPQGLNATLNQLTSP